MLVENNKTLARSYFEEVVNKGNLDSIDELFAPNHIWHDPTVIEGAQGLARLREHAADLRTHFLDFHYTIEDQIAEGDKVVTRWTFHGTRKNDPRFISSFSRPVMMMGTTINRIVDGKIAESWVIYDRMAMVQQFGTIGLQAHAAM